MSLTLERIQQVKKDVEMQIELVKLNPSWDIESINAKVDILQIVLVEIEKVSQEVGKLAGEEKKKIAIDVLNSIIDIPIIPEFVEAKIIEYAIDLSIAWFNKFFGHTWIGKFING